MIITTIKQYCEDRGVARQFVYEYIKKGTFKALELPVFAEYEGVRLEIGKKKFIQVPEKYSAPKKAYWSGDVSNSDYADNMAADATTDNEIRRHLAYYLSLESDTESQKYKSNLYDLFPINHPKRPILDAAFKKCVELMMAEMNDIEDILSTLEA